MPPCQTASPESARKIEDHRPGYPRFTALLSTYNPYFLCRQFNKLRARLLLLKQDELSVLEQRLEEIDEQEVSPLFLGKSRSDGNTDRRSLLSEIDHRLAEYDFFLKRTDRMLSFGPAQQRDIESLQNWLSGTGCLAREETAYLKYRELICLASTGDADFEKYENEAVFFDWLMNEKSHFHDLSNDPNVYIYSGPWIKRTAKALLLVLITLFLLLPVVLCNIITTNSARVAIIMGSTAAYLCVLSILVQARTIELILAGATYATVLTVFVSGNDAAHR